MARRAVALRCLFTLMTIVTTTPHCGCPPKPNPGSASACWGTFSPCCRKEDQKILFEKRRLERSQLKLGPCILYVSFNLRFASKKVSTQVRAICLLDHFSFPHLKACSIGCDCRAN
eukprot:GHVT01038923.1.p1 GENE.GHVT01038923.1~~GHVT01038923.1.p1  ORF type:complete len:116 (+),score=5.50 GHVT01038923.1:480-827(+)